jgi:hypothetical protein
LRNSHGEFTIIDLPDVRNTIPSGIKNLGDISGAFEGGEEDGTPFVSGRLTYGAILIAAPLRLLTTLTGHRDHVHASSTESHCDPAKR